MPSQVYGPGDQTGFGEQLRLGLRRQAPVPGPRRGRDRARPRPTTSPPGSSRRSTGAGSARRTSSRGRVHDARRGGGARGEASAASALPRLEPPGRAPARDGARSAASSASRTCARSSPPSSGVTYWATPDKAAAELGFTPRPIEQGFRDTFARRPDLHSTHGPRAPDVRPDAGSPRAGAGRDLDRDGRRPVRPAADGTIPLRRHPDWIKARMPSGDNYHDLKGLLRGLNLNTVCEEARCPNIGDCWDQRTATVMILGDVCTRACGFCAIKTGRPTWFDDDEPRRVAEAVAEMRLEHVVVTCVARDDLPDGGAGAFAATIRELRDRSPRHGRRGPDPRLQRRRGAAADGDGGRARHPQPQPRDRPPAAEAGPQAGPLGPHAWACSSGRRPTRTSTATRPTRRAR